MNKNKVLERTKGTQTVVCELFLTALKMFSDSPPDGALQSSNTRS